MIIRFSKKARRALRRVYGGVVAAMAVVTLGACDISLLNPGGAYGPEPPAYGMPPCHIHEATECVFIHGRVVSKTTGEPIPGIAVWVDDETQGGSVTDSDGGFFLHIQQRENYTLVFTDVDGSENGLFAQKTVKLMNDEVLSLLDIPLVRGPSQLPPFYPPTLELLTVEMEEIAEDDGNEPEPDPEEGDEEGTDEE